MPRLCGWGFILVILLNGMLIWRSAVLSTYIVEISSQIWDLRCGKAIHNTLKMDDGFLIHFDENVQRFGTLMFQKGDLSCPNFFLSQIPHYKVENLLDLQYTKHLSNLPNK